MSHWRTGICKPAFWLNREQCCWGSRDVQFDDVHNEICQNVKDLFILKQKNNIFYLVENLVGYIWYGYIIC